MRISPETNQLIVGHVGIRSDQLLDTSAWVSLENAAGVLITVIHYYGGNTSEVLTVHEGTTAAGTTAITTKAEFQIWIATDLATSQTLVRQTDGITYTINTGSGKNQMVCFYVPASNLSQGYSWVQLGATGGHAASITTVLYQLDGGRYQQTTPPTATA